MNRSISKIAIAILLACCLIKPLMAASPMIELRTNQGNIVLELDAAKAPITTDNFLKYVKEGHYNGTIFHRVMENFMIQGGGFDSGMRERKTRASIQNEANNGLKNIAGSIAMARTNAPHSASAQFFINLKDNRFLDYPGQDGWGYAVFGKVVQGFDVVQKIGKTATGNVPGHQNVPLSPIVIESARLIETK